MVTAESLTEKFQRLKTSVTGHKIHLTRQIGIAERLAKTALAISAPSKRLIKDIHKQLDLLYETKQNLDEALEDIRLNLIVTDEVQKYIDTTYEDSITSYEKGRNDLYFVLAIDDKKNQVKEKGRNPSEDKNPITTIQNSKQEAKDIPSSYMVIVKPFDSSPKTELQRDNSRKEELQVDTNVQRKDKFNPGTTHFIEEALPQAQIVDSPDEAHISLQNSKLCTATASESSFYEAVEKDEEYQESIKADPKMHAPMGHPADIWYNTFIIDCLVINDSFWLGMSNEIDMVLPKNWKKKKK